ncbi:MAG: Hsp20/alpha crystallin family protein [Halanaeroarchaeum sp.]
MTDLHQEHSEEVLRKRVDDGDRTEIVADLGPGVGDADVDVVDGTAIVVLHDGDAQYEFDLPGEDSHTFINNGVLTIEVRGE